MATTSTPSSPTRRTASQLSPHSPQGAPTPQTPQNVSPSINLLESKKAASRKARTLLYRLGRLASDTWLFEALAALFSIASLVAIVAVLYAYDGKPPPPLAYGLTLNAILSALATAMETALLCAVASAISQLKWLWFGKPQRLSDMQHLDDASRGPLGALQLLFSSARRSLATLGGIVIILALILDPFVQQIVKYPLQFTVARRTQASMRKAPVIDSDPEDLSFISAMNSGMWAEPAQFNYTPQCPSGNCDWPEYESMGWCSKCTDALPVAKLQGLCVAWPTNYTTVGNCTLSFGRGNTVTVLEYSPTNFTGTENVVWALNAMLPPDPDAVSPAVVSNWSSLGIEAPVLTLASAFVDWGDWVNSMGPIPANVTRAEECVLTPCLRRHQLRMRNGVAQQNITSTNYGLSKFFTFSAFEDGFGPFNKTEACWLPHDMSSPFNKPHAVGPYCGPQQVVCDQEIVANTTNHAFCPVNYYALGIAPYLVGSLTFSWSFTLFGNPVHWNISDPVLASTSDIVEVLARRNLSTTVQGVAASLTRLALDQSDATITGQVLDSEVYVSVRWEWLIFPIVLECLGIALLIATIVTTHRRRFRLWRSSLLPLLYRGLEEDILREAHTSNSISDMAHSARDTFVKLDMSSDESRGLYRSAKRGAS